jgi:hypothetical protein
MRGKKWELASRRRQRMIAAGVLSFLRKEGEE